jgi:hypothetical protein
MTQINSLNQGCDNEKKEAFVAFLNGRRQEEIMKKTAIPGQNFVTP